nr:SRPBCC family protein [uncultured Flavobacterium sp.]
MATTQKTTLTVTSTVNAPVEKTWELWTNPEHITQWNNASEDWHTPKAINDLRPNGKFNFRMEAKDKSFGFDFEGSYDTIRNHELIEYTIADGRKVKITFEPKDDKTIVTESFEAEEENPKDMQQGGWQAILDSFKKYAESN